MVPCTLWCHAIESVRLLTKVPLKPQSGNVQLCKLTNFLCWLSQLEIDLMLLVKEQLLTIGHLLKMQPPWPTKSFFKSGAEELWIFDQGPKWFSFQTSGMDWIVCPCPQICMLKSWPPVEERDCIWNRVSKEVFKVKWGLGLDLLNLIWPPKPVNMTGVLMKRGD